MNVRDAWEFESRIKKAVILTIAGFSIGYIAHFS